MNTNPKLAHGNNKAKKKALYILDLVPNAAIAYAIQNKLRAAAGDNRIVLGKANWSEVTLTQAQILNGAIATEANGNKVYHRGFIDQSLNGNNAVQNITNSAFNHELTNASGVAYTNGGIYTAKSRGSAAYLQPTNNVSLNGDFTISFVGNAIHLGQIFKTGGQHYIMFRNGGSINVRINDVSNIFGGTTFSAGAPDHFVIKRSGTTVVYRKNGVQVGSALNVTGTLPVELLFSPASTVNFMYTQLVIWPRSVSAQELVILEETTSNDYGNIF